MRYIETRTVPLGELEHFPGNARRGDVPAIAASLGELDQYRSLVTRVVPGGLVVLAGNHTMDALGWLAAGNRPEAWSEKARLKEWAAEARCELIECTDAEARKINLVDNRTPELGGYDDLALSKQLLDLAGDYVGTGWDEEDLQGLMMGPEPAGDDRDRDVITEPPASPLTKPGDVWVMGRHRLLCGDCTRPEAFEKLTAGVVPDLLLTDPPYCSGGFQEAGRSVGSVGTTGVHKQIANDRLSTRGYMALMKAALSVGGIPFVYVFTDWRMWVNLFDVAESSGYGVRNMIVWDKGTPGMGRNWRSQHEIVMWATKKSPPNSKHDAAHGNVIASKRTGNILHTTQKPVDLVEQLLRVAHFTGSVYDPFAGSGTTMLAAEGFGRAAYLMELDPGYCDVIARRWEDHAGEPALLNGEPVSMTGQAVSAAP